MNQNKFKKGDYVSLNGEVFKVTHVFDSGHMIITNERTSTRIYDCIIKSLKRAKRPKEGILIFDDVQINLKMFKNVLFHAYKGTIIRLETYSTILRNIKKVVKDENVGTQRVGNFGIYPIYVDTGERLIRVGCKSMSFKDFNEFTRILQKRYLKNLK